MKTAIGIDLGGSRIKGVAISGEGSILHRVYADIDHRDGLAWKNAVAQIRNELLHYLNLGQAPTGIAAPGLPDEHNMAIAYMPGRMQGLENFLWKEFLHQPVHVLNDALAALLAEVSFGAARDRKHVVLLTLGTGVGGAILIDGKPYQGAFQKAGHMGHMVISEEMDTDVTGMPGSLEECIGNCSIGKRSKGLFTSTRELLEAYKRGDEQAGEIWLRSVRQLALGLASLTNILSPQTIVLGGGITEAGQDLFGPLEEYMAQYEWRAGGNRVEIRKAMYGDLSGAIGAACFALERAGTAE